jgi:hypothetical protein
MPTVYQSSWLDDVRTEIYDLCVAFQTACVAGSVSPRPSYVYNTHQKAALRTIALTVDLDNYDEEFFGLGDGPMAEVEVPVSIRVHYTYKLRSDVQGQVLNNSVKVSQILNGLNNYLNTHRVLDATRRTFRIIKTSSPKIDEVFDDSKTVGGSMIVMVKTTVEHVQA